MAMITDERRNAKAFERANSHSKRVGFVKRALPLIALIFIAVGGSMVYLIRSTPTVSVSLPDSTIVDGKLVMANPKLDGYTSDQRAYRVSANRAIQDITGGTKMELEVLRADIDLPEKQTARLSSAFGVYDSAANTLVLPQKALLTRSDGLKAEVGSAGVDINSGAVSARENVKIESPEMVIAAETMDISDGGKKVVFETNVRVLFVPNKNKEPALNN